MSCCDGYYYPENEVGECPDCGVGVDEDGDAIEGCCYSPVVCETCGSAPCDESC